MHECTHYLLGRETNLLLESLAQRISKKWDNPLGQTTGWLRTRLSSHKSLLRGSRTKWRSEVGIDDGAGLPAEL